MLDSFLLFGVFPISLTLVLPQIVSVLFVVLFVCLFLFCCSLFVFSWVLFVVSVPPPFFLSSLLDLLNVVLVVGLCQVLDCFALLKSAFSGMTALLLFVPADSLLLSTFLVVPFQSVLVLDALVLAVSTSAYLLDVAPLLLSVLAAVVSVVGCVLALLLFLHSPVSAGPSSSLPFCLAVWFASFLGICTDISSVVV